MSTLEQPFQQNRQENILLSSTRHKNLSSDLDLKLTITERSYHKEKNSMNFSNKAAIQPMKNLNCQQQLSLILGYEDKHGQLCKKLLQLCIHAGIKKRLKKYCYYG